MRKLTSIEVIIASPLGVQIAGASGHSLVLGAAVGAAIGLLVSVGRYHYRQPSNA